MMEATDECAQLPWLHRGIVEDALIWLHFLKISMPFSKESLGKGSFFNHNRGLHILMIHEGFCRGVEFLCA